MLLLWIKIRYGVLYLTLRFLRKPSCPYSYSCLAPCGPAVKNFYIEEPRRSGKKIILYYCSPNCLTVVPSRRNSAMIVSLLMRDSAVRVVGEPSDAQRVISINSICDLRAIHK